MNAPHILILEDDPGTAEALQLVLDAEGYRSSWARNGAEGLELARLQPASLILSDLMMPVMDGLEFMRLYRGGNVPVVAMSAMPMLLQQALDLGAHGVLYKPFRMDDLLELISELTLRTTLGKPIEAPAGINAPIAVLDAADRRRIAALEQLRMLDWKDPASFSVSLSMLEQVASLFEADACRVHLIHGNEIICHEAAGPQGSRFRHRRSARKSSLCHYVVESIAPLWVPDLRSSSLFSGAPVSSEDGFRSYAGVPIFSPGEVAIGTLNLVWKQPHFLSHGDADLLRHFARIIMKGTAELLPTDFERVLALLMDRAVGQARPLSVFNLDGSDPGVHRFLEQATGSCCAIFVAPPVGAAWGADAQQLQNAFSEAFSEKGLPLSVRIYDATRFFGAVERLFQMLLINPSVDVDSSQVEVSQRKVD